MACAACQVGRLNHPTVVSLAPTSTTVATVGKNGCMVVVIEPWSLKLIAGSKLQYQPLKLNNRLAPIDFDRDGHLEL